MLQQQRQPDPIPARAHGPWLFASRDPAHNNDKDCPIRQQPTRFGSSVKCCLTAAKSLKISRHCLVELLGSRADQRGLP